MNKSSIIRFKGYKDDWEQRKFSDLVIIERGGSPRPIDDFITDSPDGLNWIKIGDAPEQGNYITKTAEKIRPEGLSKTREVHPGDLILSNSMSFGKPYIMGIDGCIHDGWLAIREVEKNFDLKFLCVLLGSNQMLEQYRSLAAGSTVNNLNKELVGNTIVRYPNKAEQQKIGAYFDTIENLITLHQRKHDKLVKLKKSMLVKMFPKKGALLPEIRFEGFTDNWELRKLNEFAKYSSSPLTVKDVDANGNYALYDANEIIGKTTKTPLLDDYISIIKDGAGVGRVRKLPQNTCILGTMGAIIPQNSDYNFLFSILENTDFSKLTSGGTIPHIYFKQYGENAYFIPTLAEQTKIGEYFCNLDNNITLHQRKLDKLKRMKKAMLEKMFV